MGKVVVEATVSLDGYVAGPNESGFEHLFAWFAGGDFEFPSVNPEFKVRLTEPDYRYMREVVESIGVFVIGRRMFDLNDGWGGRHSFDKPIVIVTHSVPEPWGAAHPDAPFAFVTDGLPSAIERARALAGDLNGLRHAGQDRQPVPGTGRRRDLDRPRARAARLRSYSCSAPNAGEDRSRTRGARAWVHGRGRCRLAPPRPRRDLHRSPGLGSLSSLRWSARGSRDHAVLDGDVVEILR